MSKRIVPIVAAVVAVVAAGYLLNAQEPVELPTVVYPAQAQEVNVDFSMSSEYLDLLSRVERLEGLLEGVEPMVSEPMVMSRSVSVARPRVERTVTVERDGQLMSCNNGQCTVTRTRTRSNGILPRLFRR